MKILLGGPGAGKTTRCLGIVEEALARGVPADQVAFLAFTRAAAHEARDRAARQFDLTARDLPHFRTIHSAAFRAVGARRDDMLDHRDRAELGEALGLSFSGRLSADGPAIGGTLGDRLEYLYGYSRARRITAQAGWHEHGGTEEELIQLLEYRDRLAAYKDDLGKLDFADLLDLYLERGAPLGVRVAVVDEAQDLSAHQWSVVNKMLEGAEVWVAGDDDQAIHRWAGADLDRFLALEGEREVLPRSHRLPDEIHALAQGVAHRIRHRYAKEYASSGRRGAVRYWGEPELVDLREGSWLLLARHTAHLGRLEDCARMYGRAYLGPEGPSVNPEHVRAIQAYEALRAGKRVRGEDVNRAGAHARNPFRVAEEGSYVKEDIKGTGFAHLWHDALVRIPLADREHYLTVLRGGARLTDPPEVRVSTIHGAKGLEADNVVLMTDLTWRTERGFEARPDDEHRVWFVGATRARSELHICAPQTGRFYAI